MARRPVQFRPDLRRVRKELKKTAHLATDFSAANRKISIFLDRWVQRNFRTQGDLVGGWTPFKIGGRRIRLGSGTSVIDFGARLLQHTGTLRASFRAFWDRRYAGIGSDLDYAEPHERGTGTLPRRRMLPQRRDVLVPIKKIYEKELRTILRRRMW